MATISSQFLWASACTLKHLQKSKVRQLSNFLKCVTHVSADLSRLFFSVSARMFFLKQSLLCGAQRTSQFHYWIYFLLRPTVTRNASAESLCLTAVVCVVETRWNLKNSIECSEDATVTYRLCRAQRILLSHTLCGVAYEYSPSFCVIVAF